MALRNGNRNGKGGKRKGAGRKPKAITLLKRQLIENGKEDAEYAYSLFVSIMHNESAALDLRMQCGKEVMDRVLGKTKQPIEHSGEVNSNVVVNFIHADAKPNGTST